MKKSDDFIEQRLLWKAGGYKLPTPSSFYFRDLSPDICHYLHTHICEETSGTPVLFFTKPTKEWTLVCTRQVIYYNGMEVFTLDIANIKSFKPPALLITSNIPDINKKQAHNKEEWHQLPVIDYQDNTHILHADKGSDLFAMWNILLMAARLTDDN